MTEVFAPFADLAGTLPSEIEQLNEALLRSATPPYEYDLRLPTGTGEKVLAELRQIPMVRPGTRLQPGATYLDLRDPQGEAFTASADMSVEDDDWYVAEATLPRRLWVRLLALVDPGRIH